MFCKTRQRYRRLIIILITVAMTTTMKNQKNRETGIEEWKKTFTRLL